MEKQHLLNWLKIAFQQPVDDVVEDFYYDSKTNYFFSITLLEKLLIDTNYKIQYHLSPYYTPAELKSIQKWIQKIDAKNPTIFKLPKYGIIKNEENLEHEINQFLFKNAIRISASTIFEILQKDPIFKIENKIQTTVKKSWWKFW